jgi:DNA-binding CsgD family transcriptional regulator
LGQSFAETTVGVVVQRLGSGSVLPAQSLTDLFGLTSREAEVATWLARGKTVADIALANGVARGTVRVQLKAIFRKLAVKSQVELIHRIKI